MSFRCASCEHVFRGEPRRSLSGRALCPGCSTHLAGLTAELMASDSSGVDQLVGDAVSVGGWLRRLRREPRSDQ